MVNSVKLWNRADVNDFWHTPINLFFVSRHQQSLVSSFPFVQVFESLVSDFMPLYLFSWICHLHFVTTAHPALAGTFLMLLDDDAERSYGVEAVLSRMLLKIYLWDPKCRQLCSSPCLIVAFSVSRPSIIGIPVHFSPFETKAFRNLLADQPLAFNQMPS
ncbi:hypothetical protein BDZ97DRAFT_56265 [Flammula alnicola]|nr:hypothetical protein BDZ97DRAFT_56265 [Flammula alnicola]